MIAAYVFGAVVWALTVAYIIWTISQRRPDSHWVPPSPLIDLAAEREQRRRRAMSRAGIMERRDGR